MAKCRVCGKYHDVYEWPLEEQPNYVPHMCYGCYQDNLNQSDDEEEESDPNNDYGIGELKPDPEDDDTPIISDEDDQFDNTEQLEENKNDESDSLPDEVSALQNIRRMLFG